MYRLFTSKATTPDDNFILKRPLVINIQSFAFTTNWPRVSHSTPILKANYPFHIQ